jgi:Flp pilus assembly protein TadB
MKELKEFVEMMDAIEAGEPIQEDAVDRVHLSDMLDELEEHLNQAAGIATDLARYGRDLPGPFAGQIRSYLAPHLENFIDDRRQPGSIASLRRMLIDSGEDEDDTYEN